MLDEADTSRRFSRILTVVSVALLFWALFPRPYYLAMLANLALVAFAYLLLLTGRGGVAPANDSKEIRLAMPLLFSGLALVLRTNTDVLLLSQAQAGVYALAGAAVLAFVVACVNRKDRKTAPFVMLLLLPSVLGGGIYADTALDRSTPRTFHAYVRRKKISRGKHTRHVLTLGPWGPRDEETEEVPRSVYDRVQEGERVSIQLYPGRLGVSWFSIAP